MTIKDGYWNVAHYKHDGPCTTNLCNLRWLTDSVDEKWVATQLNFQHNGEIYFTAARGRDVGSHEVTEQRKRHIFKVNPSDSQVVCVTCHFDESTDSCQWASVRTNSDHSYFIASCSGPDYPQERFYLMITQIYSHL